MKLEKVTRSTDKKRREIIDRHERLAIKGTAGRESWRRMCDELNTLNQEVDGGKSLYQLYVTYLDDKILHETWIDLTWQDLVEGFGPEFRELEPGDHEFMDTCGHTHYRVVCIGEQTRTWDSDHRHDTEAFARSVYPLAESISLSMANCTVGRAEHRETLLLTDGRVIEIWHDESDKSIKRAFEFASYETWEAQSWDMRQLIEPI